VVAISESDTYSRGDDVTLNCSAIGGPDVFFQWYISNRILQGQNSSVLLLSSVDAGDGGTYSCEASNNAGTDSSDTTVFIAPYFVDPPMDVDVSNGTFQNLSCVADGFPNVEYQWRKSNGTIRNEVAGSVSSMLQFAPVVFEDAGDYFCSVESQALIIQSDTVTVTGKMKKEGGQSTQT